MTTLRDHTELRELTGELDSVRGLAEALRSQAHEAANRLHTVVSLVEPGRTAEAVELATAELELAQLLTDRLLSAVEEPVLAALLLGKASQAAERGVDLRIDDNTAVTSTPLDARDLVTLVGNLVDNAIDAAVAGATPRWVEVSIQCVRGRGLPAPGRRHRCRAAGGRTSRTRSAAAGPPRLRRGERPVGRGLGSPWSARWSGGTAGRSRSTAGRRDRASTARCFPAADGCRRDQRPRRRGRASGRGGAPGLRRAGARASSWPRSSTPGSGRPALSRGPPGRPGPARPAPARHARPGPVPRAAGQRRQRGRHRR